jgi:hypothetical protein
MVHMATLTRRGALNVTADLDRLATLFQEQNEALGVPKDYALRFAFYCDAMSDTIEKHAVALDAAKKGEEDPEAKKGDEPPKDEEKKEAKKAEDDEEKKEAAKKGEEKPEDKAPEKEAAKKGEEPPKDEEKKEASARKKAQEDETGLSVDHGESGYDANAIGDDSGGPLEILAPIEAWMNGYFSQNWFQQLRDKQEGGDIGFFVSASRARLRRLAAVSSLSGLADVLKVVHAKLTASAMADVKALAADVKKQIDAVEKVRDLSIEQQATGIVEPEVVAAADRIAQAVSEQIPYLQQVVSGVDGGSPVALLEFQKMVGGGSLKDLVALGASLVADAAKGLGKKEEAKEAAKKAEEKPEPDPEEKKEAAKKGEEPPKDEEPASESSTKAAHTHNYDLFAA